MNKWTYEACRKEAQKYTTKSAFQKANGSAYQASLRNKWISDYTWFIEKKKPNGYYNYQICYEIAQSCICSSDMEKKNVTAYKKAYKNGWIKDYTWFESTHDVMSKSFTIWTKEKCHKEALKYKSRGELKKMCPSVYSKARINGWLKDYTWFETQWEKKWNYETCKEEAKKYTSRGEFSEKSPSAWAVAKKNGYIEEYDWLKPQKHPDGYWTRDMCYDVAKQCKCSSEMYHINGSAYNSAREHGWIDDYKWFETPMIGALNKQSTAYVIYAYEDEENKRCYVGLSKNWKKRHSSHKRKKNGRSDSVKQYFDYIGKEIPLPIILEEGLTPEKSRLREDYWKKEYEKKGWITLNKAKTGKNKSSLGGGFIKWNKEECFKEAKKYKSTTEFQMANPSAQRAARENGWQNEYYWFEKREPQNKKWNYSTCEEESRKYTSRGEFSEKSPVAWRISKKNGWLDEYHWLKPKKHFDGFWTEDTCYAEASNYKKFKDFRTQCPTCYGIAKKKGWIVQYTWLDKKDISPKIVEQYSIDGKLIKTFKSLSEAARESKLRPSSICACCNGSKKTCNGFIWKYAKYSF